MHGHILEYKLCALLFLRAKTKGHKFKLASNVKGFGAFDDVFLEYLDDNSRKSHIFVQVKSKQNKTNITQEILLRKGKKNDYSLHKYYESYLEIEKKFNCSEEEFKLEGSIDESLFIIYTNADVADNLKSDITDFSQEEFLMTGGSVLKFDEQKHNAIYEGLKELPKHREFLSRFRILYKQAGEKQIDCHIKRELQQSMQLPESLLETACKCFCEFIKNWVQYFKFFLKDTNCEKNDHLRKAIGVEISNLLEKIIDPRKSELDKLSIKYEEPAIRDMKQLTESHKSVLIFAPGRLTTLTAAKIHQMLNDTEHIIITLQQMVSCKPEVLFAWKYCRNVLVLESDSSVEDVSDVFKEISVILNESVGKRKFIFISNSAGNRKQINELQCTFHTNLTEVRDTFEFTKIVAESRMFFLDKQVCFQGIEVKLRNIVKNNDVRMLSTIDCELISLLLENKKPAIGTPIEDTVENYIHRKLLWK